MSQLPKCNNAQRYSATSRSVNRKLNLVESQQLTGLAAHASGGADACGQRVRLTPCWSRWSAGFCSGLSGGTAKKATIDASGKAAGVMRRVDVLGALEDDAAGPKTAAGESSGRARVDGRGDWRTHTFSITPARSPQSLGRSPRSLIPERPP